MNPVARGETIGVVLIAGALLCVCVGQFFGLFVGVTTGDVVMGVGTAVGGVMVAIIGLGLLMLVWSGLAWMWRMVSGG